MCGRYTLTYSDLGQVAELLGAILEPTAAALHRPRYNVAPSSACIVARSVGQPMLVHALWGLRLGGRFVINARSESAAARFHDAYAHGRCVVPADGFYEWSGDKGAKKPVWFHDPNGQPLLMAGLLVDQPSAPPAFTVLTAAARPPVDAIHDRMPVLLSPESARRWLSEAPRAVHPDQVPLIGTEVSPRVNATAHDDPACIAPERSKQLGLF
ncbi:MAG: SOS response-associated peptidase [Minicystis sp.]